VTTSILGHAVLVWTDEPVLIDWLGKAGTFPRYGTFSVFTLGGSPHPKYPTVSEYALRFGGCTDRMHPSSECSFLHPKGG
jgi:hypothetical protein